VAIQVTPEIETESDLEATMRDGTVLRADPGVLARLDPLYAAGRGYLVVIQDCRGRFGSDGDWAPLCHEAADGYDTVEWAARLPRSTGRVGMYGPSYLDVISDLQLAAGSR
jgi:putative CocE/NonD family hydrolase